MQIKPLIIQRVLELNINSLKINLTASYMRNQQNLIATVNSKTYKQLAIVEKQDLQNLLEKKNELEKRLQLSIRFNLNQLVEEKENSYNPSIIQNPQSQSQQSFERKQSSSIKEKSGTSLSELRKQQQIEKEKEQLNHKIEQVEREKRVQQVQFERVKDDIRQENMTLKEQSIRNKASQQTSHTQVQELEMQRAQLLKEAKKLKNENTILQTQILEKVKNANEFEVQTKQSKSTNLESQDRIKYTQSLLLEEERKHKNTIINSERLQNTINNLENQLQSIIKDRERTAIEIEEISRKHNERYNELHDLRLKERREYNDLHQTQSELQRIIKKQNEHLRQLELERERMLCRLEDLDRTQEKLRQRDRQLIELEVELEHLHRSKGNVVVERIIKEAPSLPPVIIHSSSPERRTIPPQEFNEDLIDMRRQLLHMNNEREKFIEESNYWKQRFYQVETAGDRAVNLLAQQNMDGYSQSQQKNEQYTKSNKTLKNIIMSFINDLNAGIRKNTVTGVKQIMQRHPDLSNILSQKN